MYSPAYLQIFFLFLGGAAMRRLELCPRFPRAAPPKNKKRGVGGSQGYTQAAPNGVYGPQSDGGKFHFSSCSISPFSETERIPPENCAGHGAVPGRRWSPSLRASSRRHSHPRPETRPRAQPLRRIFSTACGPSMTAITACAQPASRLQGAGCCIARKGKVSVKIPSWSASRSSHYH